MRQQDLDTLVKHNETAYKYSRNDLPDKDKMYVASENVEAKTLAALRSAIVAFEIPLQQLDGKFKLSQNKTPELQRAIIQNLRDRGDKEIADFHEEYLFGSDAPPRSKL